jgi:hypothetical protein
MNRGGSRVPLYLTAAAVLLLLGVVAVASSGSTPGGTSDARAPGYIVLDTIVSLLLVLMIPALAIFIWSLTRIKELAPELAAQRARRRSLPMLLALFLVYVLAIAYFVSRFGPGFGRDGAGRPVLPGAASGDSATDPPVPHDPEFAWIPVLVVLGLAAAAAVAFAVARRRARAAAQIPLAAEQVADALDSDADGFDDLWAEPDPRRAIIAAWVRLERALAVSGVPRRPHETAREYVGRALESLEVGVRPVRTLTSRYQEAEFSQHEPTEADRSEAITALVRIRDDLRAAASRRAEEEDELLTGRTAAQ